MIDYCYHTHTYRCGHAIGKEEDYVISAINKGYKVIGFTDHVFLPHIIQQGMRGTYDELDDYIDTINNLKEKYKDQIEIHLGFECEYGDKYKDYYKYLKEEKSIEYLICGQHLFFIEDNLVWLSRAGSKEDMLKLYTKTIIKAMKSGLFTYIAHPDLFITFFEKIDPFVEKQIRKICLAAEKYQIPLEINLGMLRRDGRKPKPGKLEYPNDEFFKIVSEYNIKCIIGIDAHNPNDFFPEVSHIDYGEELAKRHNLNLITRINFEK